MKYKNSTICRGFLTPNSDVTIQLLTVDYTDGEYQERVVSTSTNVCVESANQAGLYYFSTDLIDEDYDTMEMSYKMTDEYGEYDAGKIVVGNDVVVATDIENYDDTEVKNKITATKEVVDALENYDDTEVKAKLDETRGVVDNLENYDDTVMREKIDLVGSDLKDSKVEILDNIELNNANIEQVIKDIQLGNWEIKNNQMIMKTLAGSELARFNLLDLNGNPTMRAIFKRELV